MATFSDSFWVKRVIPRCACSRCNEYLTERLRPSPNTYTPQLVYPGRIRLFPVRSALSSYLVLKMVRLHLYRKVIKRNDTACY